MNGTKDRDVTWQEPKQRNAAEEAFEPLMSRLSRLERMLEATLNQVEQLQHQVAEVRQLVAG